MTELPAIGSYDADDDLLEAVSRSGEARVRLARPERAMVVLGRGSEPRRELHVEACLDDRVALLRRRGGGCAVVLDPGNLLVTVVLPVEGLGAIQQHFEHLSGWIACSLNTAGVAGVVRRGVSDLAVGERKIGGACIFRRKDLLYYSTTLLIEPRVDLMERYLAHPPREPDYRRNRPHREFVGALVELVPGIDTRFLVERLRELLTAQRLREYRR
ncbi:MAG: hypothetical protein JSV80_12370 [Acidobacteriota bacterium]|nr:MAG: hypothetical protein JSV80_12370 [Acidobacteriota bacterium]